MANDWKKIIFLSLSISIFFAFPVSAWDDYGWYGYFSYYDDGGDDYYDNGYSGDFCDGFWDCGWGYEEPKCNNGKIVTCGEWSPCIRSFYSGTQHRTCLSECGKVIAPGSPGTTRDCSPSIDKFDRDDFFQDRDFDRKEKCSGEIVGCGPWSECIRSFHSTTQHRDCFDDCGNRVAPGNDPRTTRTCG